MQKLVQILGCGGLSLYSGEKLAINLVVSKFADINTKIISLIKKYPLQSYKRLEFGDFCLVVEQMINKAHKTKEGLDKIKEIKARMNTRRELF
jgi:endoglucanase Acf2